ncbi:hypothetical protein V5799_012130 [Amblyomma americanum]|uniref:F-box domain-containing protein n=1 Tax=Amblyomma americanum TaxID=6943 RepID=A0AAQ4EEY0_AMBAM
MASGKQIFNLLQLPREMIALILTFLGPEDLMAVERTSRELSRLARLPCVLRTTRFLMSNSVDSFRAHLDESRAAAISELDLNNFVAANSDTVERCACSRLGCLEQLARARFRLDELDVRADVSARPSTCAVCDSPFICNEQVFESLPLLSSLRRLTLCDLPNIQDLRFLRGCVFRELRLRNLGLAGFAGEGTTAALTEMMQQVHSLLLESSTVPLDLSFLGRGQRRTSQLRRFCVRSPGMEWKECKYLMESLCRFFPIAEYIHVHTWLPGLESAPVSFVTSRTKKPSSGNGVLCLEPALHADRIALCDACNLVSAERPRNCGPRRF